MHGHNKRFREDPAHYLANTPLRVQARTDQGSVFANLNWQAVPPVFPFDLQAFPPGVQLIPFAAHPKTHFFGTQRRIYAYWLDYDLGEDRVCQLGGHANFVFTPMLDGCYVAVGNQSICHVAGNTEHGDSRGNTQAMRNLATAALGAAPVIAFDSNLGDAVQMTFVGVRPGNGPWSWYVQGHEIFYNGYGALQPVFDNNNGNALPLDQGQALLQVTDMTYG